MDDTKLLLVILKSIREGAKAAIETASVESACYGDGIDYPFEYRNSVYMGEIDYPAIAEKILRDIGQAGAGEKGGV